MILKILLLGISFAFVALIYKILLPKIKSKIRANLKLRQRKKKEMIFKNKMKKLEIL